MNKLEADFDYRQYLTAYLYCRIFPIEKTKNGFYRCRLCNGKNNENVFCEWVLPAELIEENGYVEAGKDIYFARWLIRSYPDLERDENGEPIKDKHGLFHAVTKQKLGRLIEFWNTRVFGEGSEPFKTAKKGK